MSSFVLRRRVAVVAGVLSMALAVGAPSPAVAAPRPTGAAAAAPQPTRAATVATPSATLSPTSKVDPKVLTHRGRVTAFVRTTGPGALAVDAQAKGGRVLAHRAESAAATGRVRAVRATAAAITTAAGKLDRSARAVYTTAYTVPGVALSATPAVFAALAARSDVVSIVPVVTKRVVEPQAAPAGASSPQNTTEDILTGAIQAWNTTGHTGSGITVAVIDTGLDYTHADFGGPGTVAAYDAALASTKAPTTKSYDPKKFLGGWDFAGPTYDADITSSAYDPFPQPDPNPIDGPGGAHGTHVAGTIAGYGVTAAGARYTGSYRTLAPEFLRSMRIGPGTAPGAGLYSLKVFGDNGGATDLSGAALDWVGQQLAAGTSINVINMSLGSDYGAADDPDNAKVDALVAQGVVPVIAAGNAYDNTDIGGSPGNAAGALTVGAVNSGYAVTDGLPVTAPAALAAKSPYQGQLSQNYDFLTGEVVAGSVVTMADPTNVTGCGTFSVADRTRVAKKIVWLDWDDDNVLCGSAVRFRNAADAGAIGVLLPSTHNVFESGIAGDYAIPGMQLTADTTVALRAAAKAGTLQVQLRGDLARTGTSFDPKVQDTMASFSSRGEHGSFDDVVKPDVSAPGVNVVSAGAGSGTRALTMSGTSMATPVTAGVTALAFETHPGWDALAIKADVMNTALQDETADGVVVDNLRQGTGRIDALAAVRNQVTMASAQNGVLVTASFGVVEVSGPTPVTRTVVLNNRGNAAAAYRLSYRSRTSQPGVAMTLNRTSVVVPARGSVAVTLTMSIADPAALRRVRSASQLAVLSGVLRDYVAAESGLVIGTPTTGGISPIRLAVYAAPKPVSTTSARPVVFARPSATTAALPISGNVLRQGTGATGYLGRAVPLVLGATSPALTFPAGSQQATLAAADILAVGASSTGPLTGDHSKGVLTIGIATRGPMSNPGTNTYPAALLDVDSDGEYDFETFVSKLSGSDVTVAATVDLVTGQTVAVEPYNAANSPGDYVNTFDSTTQVVTVPLAALGYTARTTATKLSYQVVTYSQYAPSLTTTGSYVVDRSARASIDVYAPVLWFSQTGTTGPALLDGGPVAITVHRKAVTSDRILLLHLAGSTAAQRQIVGVSSVTPMAATPIR